MSHSSIILLASTPEIQEAPLPAGQCPTVMAKSVSTGDPPMITTAAGTLLLPKVTAYRQLQLSPRRAHPVPDRSTSARPPAAPPMSHPSIILLASNPEIQLNLCSPLRSTCALQKTLYQMRNPLF